MRALVGKKWLLLSLSILIAVTLVLSGCGTKNNSAAVIHNHGSPEQAAPAN